MKYEEIVDRIAKQYGLEVFADPFFVRAVALDLNKGGMQGKAYVEILFRIEKDLHVLNLLKTKGLIETKNSIMSYYEGATGLGSKSDVVAALSPLMAIACPNEYAKEHGAQTHRPATPKRTPKRERAKPPAKPAAEQPPKPQPQRKRKAMPGRYEILDHFTFPKLKLADRLDAISCGFRGADDLSIQAKCKSLFIGFTDGDVPAVYDETGSTAFSGSFHVRYYSYGKTFSIDLVGRDKDFYVLLPRKRRKSIGISAKGTAVHVYLWGQSLFDSANIKLKGGFAKAAIASDRLTLKARDAELKLHGYASYADLDVADSCQSDIEFIFSTKRRRCSFFGKFAEAYADIVLRGPDMPDMPDVLPLFKKTWGRYDELDYGTRSALIDVRQRSFGIATFAMHRL